MTNKSQHDAEKIIVRLVTRRYHSEYEIRNKLADFQLEIVEEAIKWGKEQRLIDDYRFSRAFIHDALLLKPQGKRLLFMKLMKKGIPSTVSEMVLEEEYPKELEAELAQKLALKYVGSLREYDNDRRLTRLCGYLLRRGFPENLVYQVAKETVATNLDTARD